MNQLIKCTVLLVAGMLLPLSKASAEEETIKQPLSVAVLDFKEADPDQKGMGASVGALLQVGLTIHSEAVLVERAELEEVFAEQELTLSGSVSGGQAAKIGQLTGADVLVSGRIFEVQGETHLVAKIISASTSRVFGASSSFEAGKPLKDAVTKLSQEVANTLNEKDAELRGKKSIDDRVAEQMKATLKDVAKGKIYVLIPEVIISTTVPDPAAQTEICKVFEAEGWSVTDDKSEADLIVNGEAFAETGSRRGNLWFTRARLEIKVTDKDGKIIKTDRVVCGNVDLAQAVACKGALQKAGLLAGPIIAKAWADNK